MTGRSKLVAFIFATITISQITIGIYQTFLTAMNPGRSWTLSGYLPTPI